MSATIAIPPRLKLFLRRHVPSILVLVLLLPAHILLVHAGGGPAVMESGGAFPLAWIWVKCFESGDVGQSLISPRYILVMASAIFLLLGMWRLTQNRLVSIASGTLVLLHPLTVQMVVVDSGLLELLGAAFAAWAFCLHSRPRHRSARFPNRRPSPFAWPLFAVCALASLATPIAWVFPLLLIVVDLAFDRDRGGAWWERDWKGYLRYSFLIPIPLILQLSLVTEGTDTFFGPSQIVSPRLSSMAPVWVGLLAWPLFLGGLGCFALDQLSRVGDRKTVIRFMGFASSWFLVAAVIGPCLAWGLPASGAMTGMLGIVGGFSVLLFRVATRLDGESQLVTPRHVSLAWRPGGVLPTTEPIITVETEDTDYSPPAALSRTLDRLADLRPMVADSTFMATPAERDEAERLVGPLIDLSSSVIEYSPSPSPRALFIASRVGQYTMLNDDPSSDYRDLLAQRFSGLDGCVVSNFENWAPEDKSRRADLIVAVDGLPADKSLVALLLSQLSEEGVVLTLATDGAIEPTVFRVREALPDTDPPLILARQTAPIRSGEST